MRRDREESDASIFVRVSYCQREGNGTEVQSLSSGSRPLSLRRTGNFGEHIWRGEYFILKQQPMIWKLGGLSNCIPHIIQYKRLALFCLFFHYTFKQFYFNCWFVFSLILLSQSHFTCIFLNIIYFFNLLLFSYSCPTFFHIALPYPISSIPQSTPPTAHAQESSIHVPLLAPSPSFPHYPPPPPLWSLSVCSWCPCLWSILLICSVD